MVKKFLKIAGVKTEQEFYNKYPSEAAFYKAHPEARDLKQYRQGGQMKKLNQLTSYQGDIDNMMPTAQNGYGCKGTSSSQTGYGTDWGQGEAIKGGKGFDNWKEFNTPVGWNELLTYNSTDLTGKDLKQYNKDITARTKSLQTQFPGLTEEQLRAAGADSSRIRQRMGDLPRYDQPIEQTFDKAYHQFYRPLMNQSTPVTVPQILNFQAQQPGGLGGFKTTVTGNYGRKKAQTGIELARAMRATPSSTSVYRRDYEKEENDAKLNKKQALKDVTNKTNAKRSSVGKAKPSTPASKRIREEKLQQYDASRPYAKRNILGDIERTQYDRSMEGVADPYTTAAGIDKGMDHMNTAMDIAGMVTGAGEAAALIKSIAAKKAAKKATTKAAESIDNFSKEVDAEDIVGNDYDYDPGFDADMAAALEQMAKEEERQRLKDLMKAMDKADAEEAKRLEREIRMLMDRAQYGPQPIGGESVTGANKSKLLAELGEATGEASDMQVFDTNRQGRTIGVFDGILDDIFDKEYTGTDAFSTIRPNRWGGVTRAQNGAPIGSYMSSPMQQTKMMDFSQYMNPVDRMVTGSTQEERAAAAQRQAEAASKQGGGGGGMQGMLGMASQFMGKGGGEGAGGDMMSMLGGMSKGRNGIRRGQNGLNTCGNGEVWDDNLQMCVMDPNPNQTTFQPSQQGMGTGVATSPVPSDPNAYALNKKKPFNPMSAIPIAGQIYGGIQQIKAAKKAEKEANKQFQLSGLTKQAGLSRPEPIKRKYVRPEDQAINENELFPTYGVGTNYIAEDGAEVSGQVGGNETEIQNLYNPYNLYEHLGYEPLDDSERIKRYQGGGMLSGGQFSQIGQGVGAMVGGRGQGSPGGWSQIGSAIPGPIGMIAGIAGSVIDGKQQAKTKYYQDRAQKNVIDTAMQQGMQGIQSQYSNVMENGGYLSHDWQPQVIASFGGHRVSDLLRRDRMMNTLRTGGHITQNEDDNDMGPVTSMAMGGELKTHWGGYAEPMSYNPYLPEGGETVMFKGQSHEETDGQGNTGIGVTYGESPVEVERNEPAIKMKDGSTGEDNMVVYGNLMIPNQFLEAIGDPKAKGRKFKHYVSDLSKQEEKLNKTIEKNINIIDETDDLTSFDQLKFFSAKANIDGANMKLKKIAEYKMNAASVQNAINDAAAEHGLEADALARGKFKIDKNAFQDMAKWGKSIMKIAQTGANVTNLEALPTIPAGQTKTGNYWGNVTDAQVDEMKKNNTWYDFNGFDPSKKAHVIKFQKAFNAKARSLGKNIRIGTDGKLGEQTVSAKGISPAPTVGPTSTQQPTAAPGPTTQPIIPNIPVTVTPSTTPYPIVPGKPPGLISYIGDALQYIRPNTREDLDPTQLYGEMYALATNQVDPVQAQQYNPLLEQPYDISLQDQLNANQSDFNAIQRQTGYNPAAAASLAGQKYAANSKVLADQFRLNQENKAGVYNRNRGTLNQAQLQNLGILDQQMVRQETAKSKTKDVAQTALNSISDKIMKNRLDNRTLSVYENMYNYRFDKNGRAINMNPAFQPTIPNVLPVYDSSGKHVGYQQNPTAIPPLATPPIVTTGSTTTQRNGGKTPSSRNRDLVRAIKGL